MAGHRLHDGETATLDPQLGLSGRLETRPGVRPGAYSLLLSSGSGMHVFRLEPGEVKVIGRASPADLVLDDRSLSRQHARLSWLPEGVQVEDLGSKNGTRLEGEPIESVLLRVDSARQLRLGHVLLTVRRELDAYGAGFDDCERFLARLDEELLRARTFRRPLSLLMLRALALDGHAGVAQRVRKELRAVDSVTLYAPGVLLVQAPEQTLTEATSAARWLVRKRSDEPQLVCGVVSSEQFADGACTAHGLIAAVSGACRAATGSAPVVGADSAARDPRASEAPVLLSPRMLALYEVGARVASHVAPVLILGETGTGKELVARHIHAAGTRRDKPFVALNCGAIPRELVEATLFGHERGAFTGASELRRGVFEEADGGTLFLDEIGELPLPAQAALLRVLETKQLSRVGSARPVSVDVRIISATHCDLEAMVRERSFRADLYHRLNLITMSVPPLRDRPEEIVPLAQRFLDGAQRGAALTAPLSAAALEHLQRYPWPGNVRELRNAIERAALLSMGPEITPADLPEQLHAPAQPSAAPSPRSETEPKRFADQLKHLELELIQDALRRSNNNQTQAARLLDMPLRTLVYKIRAYGLRPPNSDNGAADD